MCRRSLYLLILLITGIHGFSQIPEQVYAPNIKSVQLFTYGNQLGYPIIRLGSSDQLELHFDDLDANVKNYSYTFQLCNADWTPAVLSHFDFIKGFSQVRLSTYRISSIAFTRYTHYQAVLPDRNCVPSRSGNYILKVFLNSDTSQLIFTRRMLVVQELSAISAQVQQPFNGQYFRSHQKIQFKVGLNEGLDVVNAQQQVKVTLMQNMRWDNAITGMRPTFFSRRTLEYNTENEAVFPAGKEWRWLDLRSFRLQSDRVADARYTNKSTEIFVRPDVERQSQRFNFYRDNNGRYFLEPTESINPLWQSDYATVHFTFVPTGNTPFPDKDVYLFGQLTDYDLRDQAKMEYNADKGVYETSLFLKQGYYDYMYVTVGKNDPKRKAGFENTEGDLWESENEYMILVYFRELAGRADRLIGYARINSRLATK
ncbi:MAG: DUF5103 domain-containing protein [Chitinophagaceae bacterium]|nr:DUF5103 domain-containing protein [Chitinophagaceae bacterium]